MSSSRSRGYAAYSEDYNEDANTTIPGTRQTANVAKQPLQSEVARPQFADQVRDEFSDSGYSSRTGATLGSGDSSWVSKPDSRSLKINTNVLRYDFGGPKSGEQTRILPKSPQMPRLSRTNSRTAKPPRQQEECRCQECAAKAYRSAKSPEKPRMQSQQPVRNPPPKAAEAPAAPLPTKPLPPNPIQNAPILQPTQGNPRATTSQYYRTARPMSFHAGTIPEAVPSFIPSAYLERPPSAYSSPATHQPSYSIPIVSYPTPAEQHIIPHLGSYSAIPPSYVAQQRPQPKQWVSEQARPSRHSLVYSASPIINRTPQSADGPSASPIKATHVPAIVQPAQAPPPRESRYSRDEDYYRMPPPPVPRKDESSSRQQRPTIRHAATTFIARPSIHRYRNEPVKAKASDLDNPQSPGKEVTQAYETTRRPSLHTRPSTASNKTSASSAHGIEQGLARLNIDNDSASAKQRRRMSLYGHESRQDLERSVEAYQASAGTGSPNVTTDALDLLRKTKSSNSSSRVSGGGRSSRAGSSVKSRSSTDRRGGSDVKSRNENDGLTMRFNAAHGVNVDFKGASMDGRTISVRQSKDGGEGEVEFSIGAKASNTDTKAKSRDKSRKRRSYVESSGREVEPAANSSRSRTAKIKEEIKARGRSVVGSKSRRSSRNRR